jgi:hypothetical protein
LPEDLELEEFGAFSSAAFTAGETFDAIISLVNELSEMRSKSLEEASEGMVFFADLVDSG